MTIVEQIAQEAEALPAKERQEVLKFARRMRTRSGSGGGPPITTKKTLGKARAALRAAKGMWKESPSRKRSKSSNKEISAAVRGIAGMWKDRTDLPKDPVLAVKALRARMRARGRNG